MSWRGAAPPRYKNESLSDTGVTAGSYTSTDLTVGADGRITAAANGSGGGYAAGSVNMFASDTVDIAMATDIAIPWSVLDTTSGFTDLGSGVYRVGANGVYELRANIQASFEFEFYVNGAALTRRTTFPSGFNSRVVSLAANDTVSVAAVGAPGTVFCSPGYYSWFNVVRLS